MRSFVSVAAKVVTLLSLVGVLSLYTSCTKKASQTNVFNYGNGTEPKNIDPHTEVGIPEWHVISAVFEGLVVADPKTAQPIDGVAILPPKITKNNTVYTFTLRKNAKWSNGDPVTAHDFVYGWQRLLDPKTGAKYADMLYPVKNAEAINKGKIKDLNQLGAKAIDDHTLEVTLNAQTPYFLSMLIHQTCYPAHKKTIEKHGQAWTKPENIVSNGPFMVTEWVLNKVIRTKKNPHYWDAKNVALDGVDFWATENQSTEEKLFRAGKLHRTEYVPREKIPLWQKDSTGVYRQPEFLGSYYYMINTARPGLKDKRVRKALALAIDREKIVKFVTKAGEVPARAFTPPGTGGLEPGDHLPTDLSRLEEAKKLLAEAGYPGGKGFPKYELLYNTQDDHKKIAEAIQQMWKKNLGIEVTLFNQEWKVYTARRHGQDYDICRAG